MLDPDFVITPSDVTVYLNKENPIVPTETAESTETASNTVDTPSSITENSDPFKQFLQTFAENVKKAKEMQPAVVESPEPVEKINEEKQDEPINDPLVKFLTTLTEVVKNDEKVENFQHAKEITTEIVNKIKEETTEEVIAARKKRNTYIPKKFLKKTSKEKEPEQPIKVEKKKEEPKQEILEPKSEVVSVTGEQVPVEEPTEEKKDSNPYVQQLQNLDKNSKKPKKATQPGDIKALIEKSVREQVNQFKEEMMLKLSHFGEGGGGTVAVQYADGGTMGGTLNVNGQILSGGRDISNFFGTGGGGGATDRLTSGSEELILNSDGSVTFPDNVIRPIEDNIITLESENVSLSAFTRVAVSPYAFFAYDANSNSITFDSVDNSIVLTSQDNYEWTFNDKGALIGPNNVLTVNSTLSTLGKILSGGRDLADIFITHETDSQTLSYEASSYNLSISNGNVVSLSSLASVPGDIVVNTLVRSSSADWNDTYTNLVSNSAAYLSGYDLSFLSVSGNWNDAYTNLVSNSAAYLSSIDLSFLSVSGNWNDAYTISTAYQSISSTFLTGNIFDQSLNTTDDVTFNSIGNSHAKIGVGSSPIGVGGIQGLAIKDFDYDLCDFGLQTNTGKTYSARVEGRTDYLHNGNSYEFQFSDIVNAGFLAVPRLILGDVAVSIAPNGETTYFANGAATIDTSGNISTTGTISANGGNSDQWNSAYTNISNLSTAYSSVTSVDGTIYQIEAVNNNGSVVLSIPNSFRTPGDLNVGGNLYVAGSGIVLNTSTLTLSSPILYLNNSLSGTAGNVYDIGFVGHFKSDIYQHTGLVRSAEHNYWSLFSGLTSEPNETATLNYSDPTFTIDTLRANILGSLSGNVTGNASTVTNGVYINQSYSDPSWINSLADTKITGNNFATNSYVNSTFLPLSGGIVTGNTTINGTLCASGGIVFAGGRSGSTDYAFLVEDTYGNTLFAVNSASTSVFNTPLYIGGTITNPSGNSTQWNSVYSTVQSNSATTWNYQGTDLKNLSGNWQSTYTIVTANSANWNRAYASTTALNLSSNNWNSVYSYVNSNSATNNPSYNSSAFVKLSSEPYTYISSTSSIQPLNGNNIASAIYSVILGGLSNTISASACGSIIGGGCYNSISTTGVLSSSNLNSTLILAGSGNCIITNTTDNTTGGGFGQGITYTCNNSIFGGIGNKICTSGSGYYGTVGSAPSWSQGIGTSTNNAIFGGINNRICTTASGYYNGSNVVNSTITTCLNTIVGGCNNVVNATGTGNFTTCNNFVLGSNITVGNNSQNTTFVNNLNVYNTAVGNGSICSGTINNGFLCSSTVNYSTVNSSTIDTSTICGSTIRGNTNNASGGNSSIVGGLSNTIGNVVQSFIGGGNKNCINTNALGVVVGGNCNSITGYNSSILGGLQGCIPSAGCYSSVVGGIGNLNKNRGSVIGGGVANHIGGNAPLAFTSGTAALSGKASCTVFCLPAAACCSLFSATAGCTVNLHYSTPSIPLSAGCFAVGSICSFSANCQCVIVGNFGVCDFSSCTPTSLSATCVYISDRCQVINGWDNFIGGGKLNTASGCYSFIGGGANNYIASTGSSACGNLIVGGFSNCITTNQFANTIVGGHQNCLGGGQRGFIGGGFGNKVLGSGNQNAIVAGGSNTASGVYGAMVAPANSCINCCYSFIGSGVFNCSLANYSGIVGGRGNVITTSSAYSTIVGGRFNYNPLYNSSIEGGAFNHTGGYAPANITFGANLSGNGSCTALIATGIGSCFSASNTTGAVSLMYMTSGTANSTLSSALFTTANVVTNAANCIIINGDYSACSTGLSACSIYVYDRCLNIGGCNNFIGGGVLNTASGCYGVIGGGVCNLVSGSKSTVGGGVCNCATGACSTVSGGYKNTAAGTAFVGGGGGNSASAAYGAVVGGRGNTISASHSFIGSGYFNNLAGGASSIVSGCYNNSSGTVYPIPAMQFIGSGCCNRTSNSFTSIVGGFCNTASGNYSFVAGGSANDTKSFANTFILGTALSATAANFTYVNNLSSQGVVVANPLRVGNSQAATGPVGSITGKVEIFNATGTSLGFIPVYTSIT